MAAKVKALQQWCKRLLEGYRDVNIVNMTSSWKDGLAFCAMIHKYRPDIIDFHSLSKENILHNNQLAFDVAYSLGIPKLLDAEDMVAVRIPDKLSVITYVSQMYNYFHDKTPAGGPNVRKFHGKTPSTTGMKRSSTEEPSPVPEVKRFTTSTPAISSQTPTRSTASNQSLDRSSQSSAVRTSLGDVCQICDGKVYLMERHIESGKLYHRSCLRDQEKSRFKRSPRSSSESVSPPWSRSQESQSPKSPKMSVFTSSNAPSQTKHCALEQPPIFQSIKSNKDVRVKQNQSDASSNSKHKKVMSDLLTNLSNVRKQNDPILTSRVQGHIPAENRNTSTPRTNLKDTHMKHSSPTKEPLNSAAGRYPRKPENRIEGDKHAWQVLAENKKKSWDGLTETESQQINDKGIRQHPGNLRQKSVSPPPQKTRDAQSINSSPSVTLKNISAPNSNYTERTVSRGATERRALGEGITSSKSSPGGTSEMNQASRTRRAERLPGADRFTSNKSQDTAAGPSNKRHIQNTSGATTSKGTYQNASSSATSGSHRSLSPAFVSSSSSYHDPARQISPPRSQVKKSAPQRALVADADVPEWKLEAERRKAARGDRFEDPELRKVPGTNKTEPSNKTRVNESNRPRAQNQPEPAKRMKAATNHSDENNVRNKINQDHVKNAVTKNRNVINSESKITAQNSKNHTRVTEKNSLVNLVNKQTNVSNRQNESKDGSRSPAAKQNTSGREKHFQQDSKIEVNKASWQAEVEKRKKKWENIYAGASDDQISSVHQMSKDQNIRTNSLDKTSPPQKGIATVHHEPMEISGRQEQSHTYKISSSDFSLKNMSEDTRIKNQRIESNDKPFGPTDTDVSERIELEPKSISHAADDFLISEIEKDTTIKDDKPQWKMEAEKRTAARKGSYNDPEYLKYSIKSEASKGNLELQALSQSQNLNVESDSALTLHNWPTDGASGSSGCMNASVVSDANVRTLQPRKKGTNILDELLIPVSKNERHFLSSQTDQKDNMTITKEDEISEPFIDSKCMDLNLINDNQISREIIDKRTKENYESSFSDGYDRESTALPKSILKHLESKNKEDLKQENVDEEVLTRIQLNRNNNHRGHTPSPTRTTFQNEAGKDIFPSVSMAISVVTIDADGSIYEDSTSDSNTSTIINDSITEPDSKQNKESDINSLERNPVCTATGSDAETMSCPNGLSETNRANKIKQKSHNGIVNNDSSKSGFAMSTLNRDVKKDRDVKENVTSIKETCNSEDDTKCNNSVQSGDSLGLTKMMNFRKDIAEIDKSDKGNKEAFTLKNQEVVTKTDKNKIDKKEVESTIDSKNSSAISDISSNPKDLKLLQNVDNNDNDAALLGFSDYHIESVSYSDSSVDLSNSPEIIKQEDRLKEVEMISNPVCHSDVISSNGHAILHNTNLNETCQNDSKRGTNVPHQMNPHNMKQNDSKVKSSTLPKNIHKSRSFDVIERARSRDKLTNGGSRMSSKILNENNDATNSYNKMRTSKSCDDLDKFDWQIEAEERREARNKMFSSPERTLMSTIISVKSSLDKFALDTKAQNISSSKGSVTSTNQHVESTQEKDTEFNQRKTVSVVPSFNPFDDDSTENQESGKVLSQSSTPNGHLRKIHPTIAIKFDESDGESDKETPPVSPQPKWELAMLETSTEIVTPPTKPRRTSNKKRPAPLPPASIRRINAEERVPIFTILDELEKLDSELREMEERGRDLENSIRGAATDGRDDDDALMIDWFELINQKNELVRRETLLMYRQKQQELEDEHAAVEYELRVLINKPERLRTPEDHEKEEQLLMKMLEIVSQRNAVVDNMDEDRLRYLEEDEDIAQMMSGKGFLRGHDPEGDFKEISLDDFEPSDSDKYSTATSSKTGTRSSKQTQLIERQKLKEEKERFKKEKKDREKQEQKRIKEERKRLKEFEKSRNKQPTAEWHA